MRARGALFFFVFGVFGLSGCAQEVVAHQQIEREANHILVLLRQAGVEAQKLQDESSRDLRFNVVVGGSDTATALAVLDKHNLPKELHRGTAEMMGGGGMIPTAEQEQAKRVAGVEGDIANSLRGIPRVVNVSSMVSIPQDDPLRDESIERPRPKASVVITYIPDESGAPPVSLDEVQRHVQAKLPEMKSSEVNVLLISNEDALRVAGMNGKSAEQPAVVIDPDIGCVEREVVLGIQVCAGERKKLFGWFIGAFVIAGVMAALAVVSVLRALRYRKDLTRLTAQFRQVSPS